MNIKRVFLSSTGYDLAEYRDTVFMRLQAMPDVKVVRMEDFVASGESPLETCVAAVIKSDILVGLIGHNYGSIPEGYNESFTAIEYRTAKSNNIPRLIHLAPNDIKLNANVREPDEKFEKQAAFRRELLANHTVGRPEHWRSAELLASFVSEAVIQELQKFVSGSHDSENRTDTGNAVVPRFSVGHSSSIRDGNEEYYPELVLIKRGRLDMGSLQDELDRDSCEGPRHEVVIHRDYYFGKYPVTVDEFSVFAKETGFSTNGIHVWREQGWTFDRKHSWEDPGFEQVGNHPVVGVAYSDASEYCKWLSSRTGQIYRLPSEAEWEYACRAGTRTVFWWGDEIGPQNANYDARSVYIGGGVSGKLIGRTVPVNSYNPNPWGLYQMNGNVWEWCADAWNDNYASSPSNGQTWTSGDASRSPVRGGSWLSIPSKLRSAKRDWDGRDLRGDTVGFRIVREVERH